MPVMVDVCWLLPDDCQPAAHGPCQADAHPATETSPPAEEPPRCPQIISVTIAAEACTSETSAFSQCSSAAETDTSSDANVYITCSSVSSSTDSTASACSITDDEFTHPALETARRAKRSSREWVPKTPLEFLDCMWTHILKINPRNAKRRGQAAAIILGLPDSRQALMQCLKLSVEQWVLHYPAHCQPFAILDNPRENGQLQLKKNLAVYLDKACLRKGGQGCCCSKYFPELDPLCSDEDWDRYRITGIPDTSEDWDRCYRALDIPYVRVSLSPLRAPYMLMKKSKVPAERLGQSAAVVSGPAPVQCNIASRGQTCSQDASKTDDPQQEDSKEADELKDPTKETGFCRPCVVSTALDQTECVHKAKVDPELKTDVINAGLDKSCTEKTDPGEMRTKTEEPDKESAKKTGENGPPQKTDLDTGRAKEREESLHKELGTRHADELQEHPSATQDPKECVRKPEGAPKEESQHCSTPHPSKASAACSSIHNHGGRFRVKLVRVEPLEQQYLDYQRTRRVTRPRGAEAVRVAAGDAPGGGLAPEVQPGHPAGLQTAPAAPQPAQQAVRHPVPKPVQHPVQHAVHQPVQQPVQQPVHQPVHQPISQPVPHPTQQPALVPTTLALLPATPALLPATPVRQPATPVRQPEWQPATPTLLPAAQPAVSDHLDLSVLNDMLAKLHATPKPNKK
ncbi:hypothetical protein ACOMHN_031078 [Nucella lapillus]